VQVVEEETEETEEAIDRRGAETRRSKEETEERLNT
jgi:hypothetical protein